MTQADIVLRLAGWIAPAERTSWMKAMEAEYLTLDAGRLRWALGCVGVAAGWRLAKDGLYAALVCAAVWFMCAPPGFVFVMSIELIPREIREFGLYPALLHLVPIGLLLGAYRPRHIVMVSLIIVTAMQLNGLYVWYVVAPKMFDVDMGPLWPFLQRLQIMDAHFLIGVWAQFGACLTGGLMGRALAYRFRQGLKPEIGH